MFCPNAYLFIPVLARVKKIYKVSNFRFVNAKMKVALSKKAFI